MERTMKKILSIVLLLSGIAHAAEKKEVKAANAVNPSRTSTPVAVKMATKKDTSHATSDQHEAGTSAVSVSVLHPNTTKQPTATTKDTSLVSHGSMQSSSDDSSHASGVTSSPAATSTNFNNALTVLTFPTPEELAKTSKAMGLSSLVNVGTKIQTLVTGHLKDNPELGKALNTFKSEASMSLGNLYGPLMNSLRIIQMEKFFIDIDVMNSAQAILFNLGQLVDTLQQKPNQPINSVEQAKLKDILTNVVQHTTAIALKANEHIAKSEEKATKAEPKKLAIEHSAVDTHKAVTSLVKHADAAHHEEHEETHEVATKK